MPMSIVIARMAPLGWRKNQSAHFGAISIIQRIRLADIRYHQLFPYGIPTDGDAFKVLIGDFVTTEDGTGVVRYGSFLVADDMRSQSQTSAECAEICTYLSSLLAHRQTSLVLPAR
jgi:isoleucyl-tRNA synthetase